MIHICAIIKNETLYVRDWADYHLNLGIDRITLYVHEQNTEPYRNILPYREVELVEWNYPIADDFRPQIRAYEDFAGKNQRDEDYTFFIDVDEYITPPANNAAPQSLTALIDKMNDLNRDGFVMPWVNYNANGRLRYEDKPVVERFKQISPYRAYGANIKSFFKNSCVLRVSSHLTRTQRGTSDQSGSDNVSPHYNEYDMPSFDYCKERGWWYIRHYVTKSWAEFVYRRVLNPNITRKEFQNPYSFFNHNPELDYLKDELVESINFF